MWKADWNHIHIQIPAVLDDKIKARAKATGLTRPALVRLALEKEFGITDLVAAIESHAAVKEVAVTQESSNV